MPQSNKSAKTQSATTADPPSDNVNDNCALFIRRPNKDFLYSRVFIEKEANKNKNAIKELPARDCKTKEAKISDKHRQNRLKKLPARDCKTKDGENIKTKERSDPLPAHKFYNRTLESVLAIMVVSAISATTVTSDVLHHHVFDSSTQSWEQRPAKKKPFVRVHVKVDREAAQAVSEADLIRCAMKLYGADNSDIDLLGVRPLIITDTVTGRQTRQLVYICHKASSLSLLLSLEACVDLGYVNKNFTAPEYIQFPSNAATRAGKKPDCDCECPVRETPQ